MSSELFEYVAKELFPCAELVDLRGWGESLILPEFLERMERALAYGCDIRLVTNLSFRRPAVLNALIEAGAYVGVSVDAADDELLKDIRGGANLALIVDNLTVLANGYKQGGFADRLRLYVTCQRKNLNVLDEIVSLAEKAGIGDIFLAPVTVEPISPLSIIGQERSFPVVLERLRVKARHAGVRVFQTSNLWEGQFELDASGPSCIHPWMYCHVTYDGRVGFCDHLIGPHGDPFILGRLQSDPFEEIWNGDAWADLRREHCGTRRSNAPRFSECAWCYRNRFTDFEDLLEPKLCRVSV
jgi:MoaA/NifB/PqqE/SkfB family radical SAM enzyme